jgi:hypothetical protein
MREWRYSSTVFYLGTWWRWVVSFTFLPLYHRGKNPLYSSDRRLGGPRCRSVWCGDEKSCLPLPGIESQTFSPEAVHRATELSRLYHSHTFITLLPSFLFFFSLIHFVFAYSFLFIIFVCCTYLSLHYSTSSKVAGSISDEVEFFNLPNPSSRTMVLEVDSASNRSEYQKSSWG